MDSEFRCGLGYIVRPCFKFKKSIQVWAEFPSKPLLDDDSWSPSFSCIHSAFERIEAPQRDCIAEGVPFPQRQEGVAAVWLRRTWPLGKFKLALPKGLFSVGKGHVRRQNVLLMHGKESSLFTAAQSSWSKCCFKKAVSVRPGSFPGGSLLA